MRYLGLRTLTLVPVGPGARARTRRSRSCTGPSTTRSSPSSRSTSSARRRWCPSGRWPSNSIQTDDPGAPDDSASWVGTLLRRARRHDLRRHVAGAAEHHRRAHPRPAEGTRPERRVGGGGGRRRRCAATVAVGRPPSRQVLRLAVPGWWRRPPFLPLPDRGVPPVPDVDGVRRPDPSPEPRGRRHVPALVPGLAPRDADVTRCAPRSGSACRCGDRSASAARHRVGPRRDPRPLLDRHDGVSGLGRVPDAVDLRLLGRDHRPRVGGSCCDVVGRWSPRPVRCRGSRARRWRIDAVRDAQLDARAPCRPRSASSCRVGRLACAAGVDRPRR